MIDIVSKNGCLLLNVGPRADGTITEEDRDVLLAIGDWLRVNGEAIYSTTHWVIYGEGSTKIEEGAFTDVNRESFTSDDIRFTYRVPNLYASVLKWPADGRVTITSLCQDGKHFLGNIEAVQLLGYGHEVSWSCDETGLHLAVAETITTDYPVCVRITLG